MRQKLLLLPVAYLKKLKDYRNCKLCTSKIIPVLYDSNPKTGVPFHIKGRQFISAYFCYPFDEPIDD